MNINPQILLVRAIVETIFVSKRNYYNGFPTINDNTYDALERELNLLCPNHPILSAVGFSEFTELPGMVATRALIVSAQTGKKVNELEDLLS
jgi:hypothetical protein